jgi:extracellular elastinolytic metalloproteinase
MHRSCLAVCASMLVAMGVAATGALAAPGFQGENSTPPDLDARDGRVAPSARQRSLASGLQVTWNRFGTPHAVAPRSGYLATGLSSDNATAARQWIARNRALLGIDARTDLEVVTATGHSVLLRQVFDGVSAGRDGLIAVGVRNGRVAYASSSLAQDANVTGAREMGAAAAVRAAADDARMSEGTISNARERRGWTVLDASGLDRPAQARLVAVPTPRDGVRLAWETSLLEGEDGFASFVDAETGEVLVREGLVDHLAPDNPTWTVFPNSPPQDYSSTDTRVRWCWLATTNCAMVLNSSPLLPMWDLDARTNVPTFTTRGNNALAVHKWDSNVSRDLGTEPATAKPDREYTYAWTNQWQTQKCNPTVFDTPQRNDIDAARANLFAMHNRMHDWAYGLGFTEATWNLQSFNFGRGGAENDHEHGNAQAGGRSGGPPEFAARNNANQFTPADGQLPITNMYLWQPIPAGFYSPCVDGDYDMSVIAHEYGHAISNRMAGGPNMGLSGNQPQAMGESWSDLMAVQYLQEHGFAPVGGENPFAVGPYVTGDKVAGIRNFGMNDSPLNYSDVGYDFVCNDTFCTQQTQVHADGEIWSATNYDLRQAFISRYGNTGGRRWIQLVFDAWLLMATGNVSMLDARNAILAADQLRNNGVNHDIMWNTFAKRGFGQAASSNGDEDFDPVPAFDSPYANEATVRFRPTGNAAGAEAQLFVGDYEARVTPIADTDDGTPLSDTFKLVPGTYELLARGDGFGHVRTTLTVRAGQLRDFTVNMPLNLASRTNGATASGDGDAALGALIDDTEATNWASLGSPIAGKQVTVKLDGRQRFDRIQVSAMLRTRLAGVMTDPSQSRFSALRQFELLACDARGAVDCSQASQFTSVFTSAADAFPSAIPRPRAPDLIIRSFAVPSTRATHVRLRVLTNQCTGTPAYQGDQDADPRNNSDCDEGSTQDDNVRAAELQLFR